MPQHVPGFNDDEIDAPGPFAPSMPSPAPATAGIPPVAIAAPPTSRAGFDPDEVEPPDPLTQTFDQARKTKADAAARVFNLRLQTGIPSDVISRNVDQVERDVAASQFDPVKFRRFNPALTGWLEQDPAHAAIAQDDLTPLAVIGRALTVGANAVRATGAGVSQLATVAPWSIAQWGAAAVGATGWEAYFGGLKDQANAIAATVRGPQTGAGPLERDFYSGFESLGQSLPITLATAGASLEATAAAKIATALMAINVGATETGRALDAGRTPLEALSYGTFQGEVEYVTEYTPALWFMKDLKRNPGFAKLIAHQIASEVPGEQIATVFQDLAEWATLNPDQPFKTYLDARPSAALSTLVATITMVGAQSAMVKAIDVATGTSSGQRTIEALHDAAAASKTRELAPAAFSSFVQAATKGGLEHVYAPADTFGEYFQSKGEDPAAIATALTGDPDAYRRARETGGDLEIPTARYLERMVGSGHEAFFSQELRLGPDALNVRETKARLEHEAAQGGSKLDPEGSPAADAGDARQGIYDRMLEKLVATGRYTQADAEDQAVLYASVFGAQAERTGGDTAGLFDRFAGRLSAEGTRQADPRARALPTEGALGIPASLPGKSETRQQRLDRVAGHTAALTSAVVRDAVATDPTVDQDAVARAFERRLELHGESQYAAAESGQDPGDLLRTIAQYGGLRADERSGMFAGEIAHLTEGQDTKRRSRQAATWKGVAGVFNPTGGKTLDTMREALGEDPRFARFRDSDVNALLEALTNALSTGSVAGTTVDPTRLPGTAELEALGVELGARWWEQGGGAGAAPRGRVEFMQRGLAGDANAAGESAHFIGWQHTGFVDQPSFALYNIIGGERDGSTVDAATLEAAGIPLPPTPALDGATPRIIDLLETQAALAPPNDPAFFQGRDKVAAGDEFQQDLFGVPLPGPVSTDARASAAPGNVRSARSLARDDAVGEFPTRTQLVTATTRTLGTAKVTTPDDAAAATAYLAKGAVERFDALVTDADGVPLAVVGSYRGNISESVVHVGIVVAEAFRIQGAAAIWFSHNHPSGIPTLSDSDRDLNKRLTNAFRGTGIKARGLLAIGEGQYQHLGANNVLTAGPVAVDIGAGVTVPVLERELVATGKLAEKLTASNARDTIAELAREQFGIALIDSKLQPIGFAPIDPAAAGALRTEGRLDALYRALSTSAAATAIIYAPRGTDPHAAINLAKAIQSLSISVMDIYSRRDDGTVGAASQFGKPRYTGEFFQDEGDAGDGAAHAPGWTSVEGGGVRNAPPGTGTKGSYNPITHAIKLFATADRSTFLHESAHLFLEVLSDLAVGADTTPQLQADMGTLLQFFGFEGDLAAWRALTHEQRRDAHEQFARAFETYLGEGKAPTPELQPIFSRFRAWLLGVYKSLRRLNVTLTPDVRAVMDRLVATDAQIAAAQQDAHITALFATAADAGMSEQEFAGYQAKTLAATEQAQARLGARVLKDLQRAQENWWRDERATMRATVAAEVGAEPVYRALAGMRGQLEGQRPTPLSRDALVAQFGREILEQLPRPYVYAAGSGLPADTVAELYGFASGDALIDAVIAAPPIDGVVDARTDERMQLEHGDIFHDPARLEEAARAAVADEHRDAVVRVELATLNKLRQAAGPSVKAAATAEKDTKRAGAERLRSELPDPATLATLATGQIAAMRLRDIRPERFWAAARRGSTQATQAAAKGDFDLAIDGKHVELVNLALYRAATAARADVDAAREDFAKMFGGNDAELAKRRDMDYVHAARAIAASYFWPEKRLESAHEALRLIEAADPETYALLDEQITAAAAGGEDLASMTFEAFGVMRDAVGALWDQARRTQQMLVDGQLLDRRDAIGQLAAQLDTIGAPTEELAHTRNGLRLLGIRAALSRVEHWATYVDGGNLLGPFRRLLWNPISEAASTYRIAKRDHLAQFLALVETIKDRLGPGTIAAPELGFTFGTEDGNGRSALLHALLHTGNESNFQKLIRGYQWGAVGDDGTLDASRWDAFLARATRDGLITKADWDFVQAVWDLTESVKPAAQAAHREMFGTYFSTITAWPVETPFGTYRGGYVPALVDPLRVANASVNTEKEALGGNDNASMFPSGGRGFTKARVEQYARPLALNLRLVPSHLDKVLRFIHIEPRIRDAGRLLRTHALRDRLNAYDPAAISDLLEPWLMRTAMQRVTAASQGLSGRAVSDFFRMIRARTGLNMMAGHVMNTLQQFTGILIAGVKVKPRFLRNALWAYTTRHGDVLDAVDASPFMQTRMTPAAFELQSSLEDLLLNPTKYQTVQQFGQKHGYWLQSAAQGMVDRVVWAAAYEQATELRDASHLEAIREADAAVRQTQGSFEPSDIAKFEAQTAFVRAFTMFSGYFNMLANLNGTELALVARDMGLKKGAGRALYVYSLGFMLPAILSEVITQAIGGFDDDDDDTHLDELMKLFFGSQFRTAAALVPFAGQIATAAYNFYATDTTADDRISSSPAISTLESAIRAPGELYTAVFEEGAKRRAVRDGIDLLGLLTGLPVGALKRPAGYLADVADENSPPIAPDLATVRGLTSGRTQEAP